MEPIDVREFEHRRLSSLIEDDLVPDHEWFLSELERMIELTESLGPSLVEIAATARERLQLVLDSLREHVNSEELVVFPLVLAGRGPEARDSIRGLEDEHSDISEQIADIGDDFARDPEPGAPELTWLELRRSMAQFGRRMRRHTAIEYSVLFPRILCGEDESAGE